MTKSRSWSPGKPVELDVEIWPTCLVIPAGYRIGLNVRGKDYVYKGKRSAGRLSNMKNAFTGCGPFLHDDPHRPPGKHLRRHDDAAYGAGSRELPPAARDPTERTCMKKRNLGPISVGAMGYGCMGLSGIYGASDEASSIAVLREAVELGVDFFDTADAYGPFKNEELVGRALKPLRHRVIIATKFGQEFLADGSRRINGRPDYVRSACEASLKRLGIETIDLYFAHRIDRTVRIEDTVGEMSRLVAEGKVRHIGLSEASAETIRRGHAVHKLAAVQTEYSAWSRDVEEDILPAVRALGIGFVAYSPLGRGFLTGTIATAADMGEGDARRGMPRFQGENLDANQAIAKRFADAAGAKGITAAQLALAWVLARGDDIVPIPGTRRIGALKENIAALDVNLSADEVAELEREFPATMGTRYAAPMMATLNA